MQPLADIFKALANDTRLTIMRLIFRHGHLCVCEVEQILGITQPKASRHLRYLRAAGVLEDERAGLIVNYRLPHSPDAQLSAVLVLVRGLLADRSLPDAANTLVQIREARSRGRSAQEALRDRGLQAGSRAVARTGREPADSLSASPGWQLARQQRLLAASASPNA
jgi:ArsR family transcriptional regulator, arsenate/arsenite/antimonite-responsive transcriptional repressor